MSAQTLVSLVAITIAALSAVVTAVSLRRKTSDDYTQQLERRIASQDREIDVLKASQIDMDRKLAACQDARTELTEQNFRLYIRIDELEATVKRYQG